MIDLQKARLAFKNYVSHYDTNIPSIRLKIIHTYEVMKCSDYLCKQLKWNQEDKELAALIALLHDIGRFEQWVKYESFADYKTIDHAMFSSQLLFDEGFIRTFIEDHQYDDLIKAAIEQHNKYKIDEGFDERIKTLADEIISVGDFVLTGGEIPAMLIADSIIRLLPGAITNESLESESFNENLLDYPVYTKPAVYRDMNVPDILLSGDHKKIDDYRESERIRLTKEKRPDLLK